MSSEGDRVRRAADEIARTRIHITTGNGGFFGGRCAERALRHNGASVSRATRHLGIRPRSLNMRDPTGAIEVRRLRRYADHLDQEEVSRQKPEPKPFFKPKTKVEKPKKVRTPGRQQPGAVRPDIAAAPRLGWTGSLDALGKVGLGVGGLIVLALAVEYGPAIAAISATVLTVAALTVLVGGAAWVAWSARDGLPEVNWGHLKVWLERRRQAKAVEAARVEALRVEIAGAQPKAIPMEPVADDVMQEWINHGLRTRHFDDHHFRQPEPVQVHREGGRP